MIRNLGPISKVLMLSNHGALCCGDTLEEAFFSVYHMVHACEAQLKLLPVGLDNLSLIPEETRKTIYDASRKPPEGYSNVDSKQISDNKEVRHQVGIYTNMILFYQCTYVKLNLIVLGSKMARWRCRV